MKVTIVKFGTPNNPGNTALLAYASVVLDDTWAIKDCRIIKGAIRLFVAMPCVEATRQCEKCQRHVYVSSSYCPNCGVMMPAVPSTTRKFRDVVHPLTQVARDDLEKQILKMYFEHVGKTLPLAKKPAGV